MTFSGRKTNVLSPSGRTLGEDPDRCCESNCGGFYLKRPLEVPLWRRVGGEIIQMPLQAVTRGHSPSKDASLRKLWRARERFNRDSLNIQTMCVQRSERAFRFSRAAEVLRRFKVKSSSCQPGPHCLALWQDISGPQAGFVLL